MSVRVRLDFTGVVQGVGFRPAIARVAAEYGVTGFVYNDSGSVRCELEGPAEVVDAAVADIERHPPSVARIDTIEIDWLDPLGSSEFRIIDSHPGSGRTLIPPDIATCADCLRELRDVRDRRYGHPFITCTNCGPRYTVITDLPYDRSATTMAAFAMCAACDAEYRDPLDRRFHAQTVACPDCGPRLMWHGPGTGADPLDAAVQALRAGLVIAIKGIGGYHLACLAEDPAAVALLRRRKNRPAKPFAVMAGDLDAARRIAHISVAAAEAMTSAAAPIVLAPKRRSAVAAAVAPGVGDLGVLLAYSPIHHLLFDRLGALPLVLTSANQGGSPIVFRDEDLDQIADVADGVLCHDRPIHVPCEDSVLTVDAAGQVLPLRRSRGYAPLPVSGPGPDRLSILATGGDLKTTFCLMGPDGNAHLSSHLGDMADPRTQACFESALDHLARMTDRVPDLIVCDMHPSYATTRWAGRHAGDRPAFRVQHHHAHAVSLLAEHHRLGTPMLAVAYDGTGYGTDGTIWGGELLLLTDPTQFTRMGHLAPFALPGGDSAVRQPARIALDLMHRAGVGWDIDLPPVAAVGPAALRVLAQQIQVRSGDVGCVSTSSMGRLFDAVSSLLGVCQDVTYEGQAAVELECLARAGTGRGIEIDFALDGTVLDSAPVIASLVDGLRAGVAVPDLAAAFHDAVIRATTRAAAECAASVGISTIGLTGGVFANRLLLDGVRTELNRSGFEVLTHRVVPCNDGGLALGQAAIAAAVHATRSERTALCASESPAS